MGTDLAPPAAELGVAPPAAADSALAGGGRAHLTLRDGLLTRAAGSMPIKAFVASRLLVFITGAIGVLTVPQLPGTKIFNLGMAAPTGVGRLLAGSTVRYDSFWYLRIATKGYASGAHLGSRAFFPLYPWLIRVLGVLTGSDATAGIAISLVSFAGALLLLHRLTELELGRAAADATVLLLAFAPLSVFFSAVYTESLFLVLSLGSIYAARQQRWALAGVLGALAAATRVTGVALVIPIAIMYLRSSKRVDRRLGWALLIPTGLLAYLAWLQTNGTGWRAPFTAQAKFHGHITAGPAGAVSMAAQAAVRGASAVLRGAAPILHPAQNGVLTPQAEAVYLFVVLVVAIIALERCCRTLPIAYGAYAACALLITISSPQLDQPLAGLDRYVLTIFPLWMVAGAWLARRRLLWVAVGVSTAMLVFYTLWFSAYAFLA